MTNKKKRPASLPVMGVSYDLSWGRGSMPADSVNDWGETEVENRRIYINTEKHATEAGVESTLLHEVIHAVLGVAGHGSLINDDAKEEALVTSLENGLYPIICDLVRRGYFRSK